jgi:hypothetical protein
MRSSTVNDAMVAALHRTIAGWNAAYGYPADVLYQPDFGDGPPLDAGWLPSVWMPTGVAVGLLGHDGRLFVTLRYCRELLGRSAAERFLADYVVAAQAPKRSRAPRVRQGSA